MPEKTKETPGRVVILTYIAVFVLMVGAILTISIIGRDPVPSIREIHCMKQTPATVHFQTQLAVYVRGQELTVPAGIGHRPEAGCTFWLHTEAPGMIDVDSPERSRDFSLGDFFAIWGRPLDAARLGDAVAAKGERVQVWIDGQVVTGAPEQVALKDGQKLVVALGPPWPNP
ncbi:MAG TPA: hypothetical protein VFK80_00875 [Limnochordia bacterium]|nr:hypothetical protein [Limnochordia bacterium]